MVSEDEIKEAEETPESECFDCADWNRGGYCCPAHGVIRKRKCDGVNWMEKIINFVTWKCKKCRNVMRDEYDRYGKNNPCSICGSDLWEKILLSETDGVNITFLEERDNGSRLTIVLSYKGKQYGGHIHRIND